VPQTAIGAAIRYANIVTALRSNPALNPVTAATINPT
jgi:hypothetical protein